MNYFIYKKKGFTLVELLVVIAILALLSTIIILGMNDARTRAKNTAIRENLISLRPGGGLWINTNGTYLDFCADNDCNCVSCSTYWKNACFAIKIQNGNSAVTCNNTADAWCVSSPLAGGGNYCVDSLNKAGNGVCPAAPAPPVCP